MSNGKKEELSNYDLSAGDKIRIKTSSEEVREGFFIPSAKQDGDIVLKLESGYNIGLKEENIEKLEVIERKKQGKEDVGKNKDFKYSKDAKNVLILHTGGTIASRVSYEEGGVKPGFSVEDLKEIYPEIFETANISSEIISQMLSEDMEPSHWKKISEKVFENLEDFDGIIISHGTDTMQYTASALSFMIKNISKPVVLVGSQRSSDRPSSDSFLNLKAAVKFIEEDIPGVFVCMHGSSDDEIVFVHRGTRVRKMHTSRRDAFKSIRSEPFAEIDIEKDKLVLNGEIQKTEDETELLNDLDEEVGFLKVVPGMKKKDLEKLEGCNGLIIEGTGLGHLPVNSFDEHTKHHEKILGKLEEICEDTVVCMTSQCINGRVNLDVYDSGVKIKDAGVVSGRSMLPGTAYVKLMWALGNSDTLEESKDLLLKNVAGEFIEREDYDVFR